MHTAGWRGLFYVLRHTFQIDLKHLQNLDTGLRHSALRLLVCVYLFSLLSCRV